MKALEMDWPHSRIQDQNCSLGCICSLVLPTASKNHHSSLCLSPPLSLPLSLSLSSSLLSLSWSLQQRRGSLSLSLASLSLSLSLCFLLWVSACQLFGLKSEQRDVDPGKTSCSRLRSSPSSEVASIGICAGKVPQNPTEQPSSSGPTMLLRNSLHRVRTRALFVSTKCQVIFAASLLTVITKPEPVTPGERIDKVTVASHESLLPVWKSNFIFAWFIYRLISPAEWTRSEQDVLQFPAAAAQSRAVRVTEKKGLRHTKFVLQIDTW